MPERIVIADTSCLIILTSIGELDLLREVFGEVAITEEISKEFGDKTPTWIKILQAPSNLSKALKATIDEGEASAIALALDCGTESLLILDDLRARKYAKKVGLNVLGTIGVIVRAQKRGHIANALDIIGKIQQTNFRLSPKIIEEVKKELNN